MKKILLVLSIVFCTTLFCQAELTASQEFAAHMKAKRDLKAKTELELAKAKIGRAHV